MCKLQNKVNRDERNVLCISKGRYNKCSNDFVGIKSCYYCALLLLKLCLRRGSRTAGGNVPALTHSFSSAVKNPSVKLNIELNNVRVLSDEQWQ